ncbi:hypothetical protein ACFQ5J_10605 [Lacticaseibacillus baoqingensis]|uniref:Uncharacterized protein n=1 Tax=Lacticaseibacillus baoqingensis TaxID=2486013 RepID=A0ABW4EAR2_9LACO|nr:hypothetical protein [Lacticaseibacillus baoqingensis]
MKREFWTLNRVLTLLVYGMIACFVIGHATPTLAVRTKMLFHGYLRSSLTAQITKSKEHGDHGEAIYFVSPSPVNDSTAAAALAQHTILLPDHYRVTTFGLSFAEMATSMG